MPGALMVTAVMPAAAVPRGSRVPVVLSRVPAGVPSPADGSLAGFTDLAALLDAGPSCYWVRAEGESMTGAGILSGDLLLVDTSVEVRSGDVVVAAVDGDLTVKRYVRRGARVSLLAANPAFAPIELGEGQELVVWGVVTAVVRQTR